MNRFHQLREMLPVALLFHLLVGLAHWPTIHVQQRLDLGPSAEKTLAGLKWHMLQIARNERNEALPFYPGD